MLRKILFITLISALFYNSANACRFEGVSRDRKTNDVHVNELESVCAGKNNFNQDCPYRQFLINRVEIRSCDTQNDGHRTDYKVYENNKLVKTYCEGDCNSPVMRTMTPVCYSGVKVKNVLDKWEQAEKEHYAKYYKQEDESSNLFGKAKKLLSGIGVKK